MTVKFHPDKNTLPQPINSFWLYLMGGDGANGKEYVALDFENSTREECKKYSVALDKLNGYWSTGQKLEQMIQPKICHPIVRFEYRNKNVAIYSYRHKDSRVYFIYPDEEANGILLVIKLNVKQSKRLKPQEIKELKEISKLAIDATMEIKNVTNRESKRVGYSV